MFPQVRGVIGLAILVVGIGGARAQGGYTWQETPGLALVKPQAWSKESQATVLEFEAFVDRRATGSSGAGYIEFRISGDRTRQVDASRLFKVVVYPDASRIVELVTSEDRDRVQGVAGEIEEVIKRFPSTKRYLEPRLEAFLKEIGRFDAGEVKVKGTWISNSDYRQTQAARLSEILKAELASAPPEVALDIETDTRYQELVNLGRTIPAAKKMAVTIRDAYAAREQARERAEVLQALKDPSLPIGRVRDLVQRLRGLNAEEDPAAAAVLKTWEDSDSEAVALAKVAEELAGPLNKALQNIEDFTVAPEISEEVTEPVASLGRRYAALRASNPPPQIFGETGRTGGVVDVASAMIGLRTQLPANDLFAAKVALDKAAGVASSVGPAAVSAVEGYQKMVTSRIEVFTKARQEATAHEEAGRTAEALAKYKEAYAAVPEAAIGEKIAALEGGNPSSKQ